MMPMLNGDGHERPGDERRFIHKSFIGRAVGGVVKRVVGATPVGAAIGTALSVAGTIRRGFRRRPARDVVPVTLGTRPGLGSAQGKEAGRSLKFGGEGSGLAVPSNRVRARQVLGIVNGGDTCPGGTIRTADGFCVSPESEFGKDRLDIGSEAVGNAVMGRYGAALEPGNMIIDRAVCLRGMQLGDDGLCYNKSQISNKQRMWPKGRRPLLTGGDMRAIGIASRAGKKLERTTKRLQTMGMLKKPAARDKAPRHQHAKLLPAASIQ